jgi:hypothetical protein
MINKSKISIYSVSNSDLLTSNNTGGVPYNPWEDNKMFVQDVGDIKSFINFLNENKIQIIGEKKNLDEKNCDDNINLLRNLNDLSKVHFEKISVLEILYEKYRNESILSKNKNYLLIDSINYLTEMLRKFEENKIKIANLLHNTQFSENNIIKIKHQNKHEFIKALKIILNKVLNENTRNELELINLSLNMHSETIKKLVRKYKIFNGSCQMEYLDCILVGRGLVYEISG